MGLGYKPESSRVSVHLVEMGVGEIVSRIGLGAKKILEFKGFRGKMR
jgi:hypothetical protein